MGVYKLGSSLLNKIKGPGERKKLKFLPHIQHYFIDVNGILHNVAQKVFAYRSNEFKDNEHKEKDAYMRRIKAIDGKNWKDLMGDYQTELYKAFDELLRIVAPSKTFALCVDGVAPAAKIAQQRNRRLGGSSNVSLTYPRLDIPRAQVGFSNTMITPGTGFMIEVDSMIQNWVYLTKERFPELMFIYSSHLLHGEGEHKIFQLIESMNIGCKDDNYGIDGVDSDLVSLTLVRPHKFFLIRSEREEFISMSGFKEYVYNSMKAKQKKFRKDLVLKDFVLLLYIVGNDFLPRFLFVEDVGDTIAAMMDCYVKYTTSPLTTDRDTIDWTSLGLFMAGMVQVEESFLRERSTMFYAYPHPVLHSVKNVHLAESHSLSYFEEVRTDWYNATILPKLEKGKEYVKHLSMDKEIDRVCDDMCKGLLWVLRYYTSNTYSKSYSYNRFNAPLISDLAHYLTMHSHSPSFIPLEDVTTNNLRNDSFNVISQLMSVLPEKYNFLIPEPFNKETLPGGKFNYLNPIGFPTKREGLLEEKDWFMEKSYLPLVDPREVIDFVDDNREKWPSLEAGLIENRPELLVINSKN